MNHAIEITDNQFNIGYNCTRRQIDLGRGNNVALRFINHTGMTRSDYTFSQLEELSNLFSNSLIRTGYRKGDVIGIFLPKMPELFFTFLGILKIQAIVCPLFANFGDEALLDRLTEAKCIITRKSMMKRLRKIKEYLPRLKNIILVDIEKHVDQEILSYQQLIEESDNNYSPEITSKEIPSLLHYTSGTTGKSKGVLHLHGSILSQSKTSVDVLQLKQGEIYWCTADQGWVTGVSYGIIGPWSSGVTQIQYSGGFDPQAWFALLQQEKVSIWYTAPTALRMLMREDPEFFKSFDLSCLKYIFSVGEPLNPKIIEWSQNTLGKEIYDTWFQTETGSIMIANQPGFEIKPGSMGKPVEGILAEILDENGNHQPANTPGNLCLSPGWPSMFITYLGDRKLYLRKFKNGYYFTGDTAYKDNDGYFWYLGRGDDVINSAGHLISPFEVESSLIEIDEIAESGVIGAMDEILHEKVVAFVVLKSGIQWSPELEVKVRLHVTNRISAMACPQDIHIIEELPKNKSGKIMRRVLKCIYEGKEPENIATMEI